jgi:hypothetical protein
MPAQKRISVAQRFFSVIVLGWGTLCAGGASQAAVAVITNRTTSELNFSITAADAKDGHAKATDYKLASGDLTVVNLPRGTTPSLSLIPDRNQKRGSADAGAVSYKIQPDAAYYFGELPTGKVELGQIGIGEMPVADPPQPVVKLSPEADDAARTITVKVLVDEEEPSKRSLWERRLRDRVAAASDIIEHHCGIKLKVIATDTWQSDNRLSRFEDEATEFIKKVDPGEARLAIGFTSQFEIPKGRTHLGGTRGPFARHILLREWSQIVSEPERLELLVHEVGHFLGAVHSPESDSVMRVVLGDRQARAKKFQIRFDPLNTLAMNLVAEEWHQHPLKTAFDLSQPTKDRLHAIYQAIDQALPDDPAAAQYLHILERTSAPRITIGSQ